MKEEQAIVNTPFGKIEVEYDPSLNKYDGEVLFPEKLAKAKEALKSTNLLEIIQKHPSSK